MSATINRISALLLLAFVLLAGALGLIVSNGPSLVAREDNPRPILTERRIPRGRILDRHGEIIVESIPDDGFYTRRTRYPNAAPFAGYYSINYGTSGVEQAFDSTLRGTLGLDPVQARVNDLLHLNPIGHAVQLTIDLSAQRLADSLLGHRTGAVVVLSVPDGDLLALSSHPTFDPNTLDEQWDALRADLSAPLLNRATQGQYQPGTALQPILLGEALRREAVTLDDTPEFPAMPFRIDARTLACRDEAGIVTLADAFRSACPGPFADLGPLLGGSTFEEIVVTWGLTETNVVGVQGAQPITSSFALTDTQALRQFAVGQGPLTVTPLHMALAASTLAAHGELRPPRIVSATESIDGVWKPFARSAATRLLPANIADQVVAAMPHTDDLAWHAGEGLSGSSRLRWFIGLAPIDRPRYAVVVLIEDPADATAGHPAIEIGQALLAALSR